MLFHFSVEKTEAQKEWGAHAEPQLAEVRPAAAEPDPAAGGA